MPFAEQMTKTLLSLYSPESSLAVKLYRNYRITGVPTEFGNNLLAYKALGNTCKDKLGGTFMGKLLNIIPVSDLRQDAAKILKKLRNNKEPLKIIFWPNL